MGPKKVKKTQKNLSPAANDHPLVEWARAAPGDGQCAEIVPGLWVGRKTAVCCPPLTVPWHAVLSVGPDTQRLARAHHPGVLYHRDRVVDEDGAMTPEFLARCVRFLHAQRLGSRGEDLPAPSRILVHCSAGMNRSPAVVVAYLMTYTLGDMFPSGYYVSGLHHLAGLDPTSRLTREEAIRVVGAGRRRALLYFGIMTKTCEIMSAI